MNKALGIDIGGTKISCALINTQGEIISEVEKFKTPKTSKEIEQKLKEIISKYEQDVDFTAIATAGAVNNENNKITGSTANLPAGYKDIDFMTLGNKKIFIENDANCACWAEYKKGASFGYKNSIMLTLGTGVGGGIIINSKLLKGSTGAAGEMHFPLSRASRRLCTCNSYDCYEIYASGNGLKKTGEEIFEDKNITTYDIIEKAKNNDKKALRALEIWQEDIARGMLGLQNIFDTECFVLSGSMEQFVDVKKVEEYINNKTVTSKTKVFHAKAGNMAGMIGAVLLGYDTIL